MNLDSVPVPEPDATKASRNPSVGTEQSNRGQRHGPLNPYQLGVWLHEQASPNPIQYVEPLCFPVDGPIDVSRLASAVARAAAAHPVFGAVVESRPDGPMLVLDRHSI